MKFEAATRTVSGWKELPFPAIEAGDPAAGDKVAWNARYGLLEGYAQDMSPMWRCIWWIWTRGVERVQNWA